MVEVGVGEQQHVDAGRIEAERLGVGALDLLAALEHAAVDQHAAIVAGDQVARTGDLLGGTVAAVDEHRFLGGAGDWRRLWQDRPAAGLIVVKSGHPPSMSWWA